MLNLTWYWSTWINSDIQNYLADIQENNEIISWKYITNSLNPNFKEMVKHLFPWEIDRFKILNPWSYIWGLIDDKISAYVWIPKDNLNYRFNYDMLIETLLTTWFVMMKLSSNKKEGWKMSSVEWHKYFDDWVTELFIEQYKVEEKNPLDNQLMNTKHYVYVQSFSNNTLKNELFEIQPWILSYGKPVSLSIIPELAWRPDEQIIMEIDKLVHKIKIESSLITKIKSIIYSIERKYAEADKQFQNYMDQFIVMQNIEIPKHATKTVYHDGNPYEVTDFDKLGKIVEIDADNWTWNIQIIKNWNELIKEALEFAEKQLQMISAITDVPKIFLWLNASEGNNSWTFIVKSSWAFYKRIERYRTSIENVFEDIIKIVKIKQLKWNWFIWPSIITTDPSDIIEDEIKLVEAGLSTKIMSIMKIHNVNENEAKKINEEIKLDQKIDIPIESSI